MRRATFCQRLAPIFGALLVATSQAAAQTQSVSYLGRTILLAPPQGFCTLGNSPGEKEMETFQKHNTAPAGELAQIAVPCDELVDFRTRKTDKFTKWVQVLVLKQQGQMKTVTGPRANFLLALGGNLASQPPDMNAVSARLREHLSKTGSSVTNPTVQPIGSTADAVFMQITMTATVGSFTSPVVAVMAITVVNQLPLAVYAYATPKARGESPVDTSATYLRSVIQLNF